MDLKDERDNLVQNVIWAILTALGAAALPLLEAHWRAWSEPTLFAFLGATWVAVVYTTLTGKRPFSGPGTTPKNLEGRVKAWLDKYRLGQRSDPDDSVRFRVIVSLPSGGQIALSQPKEDEHHFVCQSRIILTKDFQNAIAAMSDSQRERTQQEITLELARAKITFRYELQPAFLIDLFQTVPVNPSLTEEVFTQVIDTMDFALNLGSAATALAITRNSQSQPKITPESIGTDLKQWLDDFGFGLKSVRDESSYFNIQVTFPNGHHVTILRQKDRDRYLTFVCVLTVEDELQKALASMTLESLGRTILEIKLELSRAKIAFDMKLKPSFEVTISRRVLITPTLTSDSFIEIVNEMDLANSLALTAMTLAIDRNSAPSTSDSLAATTGATATS